LVIIAYGSLAMQSMHLDSDFDIVFVLDKDITDNNHRFVMRWIKRIMHLLTAQTYSGYLYQLDTQLRPNGNSGAVVVSHNNFKTYQLNNAWVWEHAALIKTRVVYGTEKQKLWFDYIREQALCRPRNAEMVMEELNEMANKLQQHNSKKHQVEFKNLADILIKAHLQPELINQNLRLNDADLKIKLDSSIHS
jgi:glutamate-ammonia-ligase adenylyltransferase